MVYVRIARFTLDKIRSKVTGIIGFELLTLVIREQNDFQKK
jgi:hypothetical protein